VIELEKVSAGFAVGELTVLQPVGWTTQISGGVVDSRRAESLLDIAELLQFAGPSLVVGSLEGFIDGSLGVELGPSASTEFGEWTVRTGNADGVAVDFYERDRGDGNVDLVLLIAGSDEIGSLRTQLLEPVVEGFGVE